MVLPLVPLIIVATSAVAGSAGAGIGTWGGVQMLRAKKDMKIQLSNYENHYAAHSKVVEDTNGILCQLGDSQLRVQHDVIYRMRDFLERNSKQVIANEHIVLEGRDASSQQVAGLSKRDADVAGWLRGVVGVTIVGGATPVAIRAGVVKLATASTGTAIVGLKGAAATSATLAWLGGDSLATGGGGIALGTVMLNVAAIGPTFLVAGITVKNRGSKARTEAEEYRTAIEIEISNLQVRSELFRSLQLRATELVDVIDNLATDAIHALEVLESEDFVADKHTERLQKALILVKAVRDVATAQIADEQGNPDNKVEDLILKYRNSN